jgi:hypothetical protein
MIGRGAISKKVPFQPILMHKPLKLPLKNGKFCYPAMNKTRENGKHRLKKFRNSITLIHGSLILLKIVYRKNLQNNAQTNSTKHEF